MQRRILRLYVALMALSAYAVLPSIASATRLEDTSAGNTVVINAGSKVKAISEGTFEFAVGTALVVRCNENFLTGEVDKNKENETIITILDAKFQSNLTSSGTDCESNLGPTTINTSMTNEGGPSHWCIQNVIGTDTFNIFGRNCTAGGEGSFTITLEITTFLGKVTCKYIRNGQVGGTFTTPSTHEASTLAATGTPEFALEAGSSGACPSANGKINEMKFKLYTDTAVETSTWDDAASTGDPVWFRNLG